MTQRTSFTQFSIMVEYMERHGDLTKFSGGARGRQWSNKKWRELVIKLNSEGNGKTATEEKWRKAWSDFKNNTKKKWAKIKKSLNRTGGGCALKMSLSDLEHRVLAIIGEQAATGMQDVPEVGLTQDETAAVITVDETETAPSFHDMNFIGVEELNVAGPSQQQQSRVQSPRAATPQSITSLSSPARPVTPRQPPQAQRMPRDRRLTAVEEIFVRMEENNMQRDRDQMEIERENNRLRESELQLRRDGLELKSLYLSFMKEAMRVLDRFLNCN